MPSKPESSNEVSVFTKRFGDMNIDRIFYVIRQPGQGRGLFSLLSSVLCHLDIAESLDATPVVDFQNFPCVYNDPDENQTLNSWEYFFSPVSRYSLDEVYSSRNVLLSATGYPAGYSYTITAEPHLKVIAKKYISFNSYLVESADDFQMKYFLGKNVLGVHFRGQEFRTAPGHWYPPTKKQIVCAINDMISLHRYDKIFLVSEDAGLVDFIMKEYGEIVCANEHFRTYGDNAYRMNNARHRHFLRLGEEAAIDCLLLSRCQGLVACTSNVSNVARFFNDNCYKSQIQINNGPNFNRAIAARYSWRTRSVLPNYLGGFNTNFRIMKRK